MTSTCKLTLHHVLAAFGASNKTISNIELSCSTTAQVSTCQDEQGNQYVKQTSNMSYQACLTSCYIETLDIGDARPIERTYEQCVAQDCEPLKR